MKKNKLSLIIPAHNEERNIKKTILAFHKKLSEFGIPFDILVVNDHSADKTDAVVTRIVSKKKNVKIIENRYAPGFGFAVRTGLDHFKGNYAAIVMADLSDDPNDLVTMYFKALEGYDCVFGNRFTRKAKVTDYPIHKLLLNRFVNNIIRILFMIRYKDVTNAFKLYSRETIMGLRPIMSNHFNLTVELPLKAIIRGYSYAVVATNWTNRTSGISNLKIKEMGGRYFFIILYCFLEKLLSHGDYYQITRKDE